MTTRSELSSLDNSDTICGANQMERDLCMCSERLSCYVKSTRTFEEDFCSDCDENFLNVDDLWRAHLIMSIEGLLGRWDEAPYGGKSGPMSNPSKFEPQFAPAMSISSAGCRGDHIIEMYAIPNSEYPSLGMLLHHYSEVTHWHGPSEIALCGTQISTLGQAFRHASHADHNWGTVYIPGSDTKCNILAEDGETTRLANIPSAEFATLPTSIQTGLKKLDGTPWIDAFLPCSHNTPVIVLQGGGDHLFALAVSSDSYIVINSW